MVPEAGLEPAPCRQDWILSPARLPIPSFRQRFTDGIIQQIINKIKCYFKHFKRNDITAALKVKIILHF